MDFAASAANALGATRTSSLSGIGERVGALRELTEDVATTEVLLLPLKEGAAQRWERLATASRDEWVFVKSEDEASVLAMDEPSEEGLADPAAAVIYPELHTRLVSWWLVHAWRGVDLLDDTVESLAQWRITSAAVTSRAVIEEAGCLLQEANQLASGWKAAKASPPDALTRPSGVRRELGPPLARAGLGSRIKGSSERAQATNVLTYVKKLVRATGEE
jgi:hypothetical protein